MASYYTMQKRLLTEFLATHGDAAFTVAELTERMKNEYGGDAPGKSTLYRLITKLAEDGEVKKIAVGEGRSFVYQISEGSRCNSHLHMKCTKCGKLLHMDDFESARFLMRVMRQNDFAIDESRTILLGHCKACGCHAAVGSERSGN